MKYEILPGVLRASFPEDDGDCERPTIDLPNGLQHRWIMQWMEVHVRSEHMLGGRRYDGELQMMHLGLEGQKRSVAIISTLLDASALYDNKDFQKLLDGWQEELHNIDKKCASKEYNQRESKKKKYGKNYHGQSDLMEDELYFGRLYHPKYGNDGPPVLSKEFQNATEVDHERRLNFPKKFLEEGRAPRHKMFPYIMWPTIHYYRYKGGLTRPPCSEIVQWRVFDEPMRISRRQYMQLAKLINSYRDPETCKSKSISSETAENYRPIQLLNNEEQEVTHCTDKDFSYWMYLLEDQ